MTISITVSVNGNYRVAVTEQHGTEPPFREVISGRGHDGPNVKHIPHYHGTRSITTVTVGPEEEDRGEGEN